MHLGNLALCACLEGRWTLAAPKVRRSRILLSCHLLILSCNADLLWRSHVLKCQSILLFQEWVWASYCLCFFCVACVCVWSSSRFAFSALGIRGQARPSTQQFCPEPTSHYTRSSSKVSTWEQTSCFCKYFSFIKLVCKPNKWKRE